MIKRNEHFIESIKIYILLNVEHYHESGPLTQLVRVSY